MRGKVKWFNDTKGYGFIAGENGKDVFVHYSSIMMDGHKKLDSEDEVEYEIQDTPKGPAANNVELVLPARVAKIANAAQSYGASPAT
jgi:CspA family cold shock protein